MGVYSEKLKEVSKIHKINIEKNDLDDVDEKVSKYLSQLNKEHPEKVSEASEIILYKIGDDFSKIVDSRGRINIENLNKTLVGVNSDVTKNDIKDNEKPKTKEDDNVEPKTEKKEIPVVEDTDFKDNPIFDPSNSITGNALGDMLGKIFDGLDTNEKIELLTTFSKKIDVNKDDMKSDITDEAFKMLKGIATQEDFEKFVELLEKKKPEELKAEEKAFLLKIKLDKENNHYSNSPEYYQKSYIEFFPKPAEEFFSIMASKCKDQKEFEELLKESGQYEKIEELLVLQQKSIQDLFELEKANEQLAQTMNTASQLGQINTFEEFENFLKTNKLPLPTGMTSKEYFEQNRGRFKDLKFLETFLIEEDERLYNQWKNGTFNFEKNKPNNMLEYFKIAAENTKGDIQDIQIKEKKEYYQPKEETSFTYQFDMGEYDDFMSGFEQDLGLSFNSEEQEKNFLSEKLETFIEEYDIAKISKSITGITTLNKVMAKPKEMVLDYLEMDINSGTDPKNATLVMADMLRDKKLLTKFKGASETGLSLEEYAEIMSGVVMETEQLIEEGKLPETITENGVDRQTSIDDFINMTFDDTEILLSNLPGRISDLSKEEIAVLITAKVKEAEQELQQETPEVEEIQEQESEQKIFTKTISSIFPIEETKKQGIDLSKVGLEDFVEVLDAFASGDKAYLMQVLMKQTTKEMKYLIDNFKNTLGMSNYIEQNGFVPKEVMDKWKQMEAEGKDPFEEMRKAPEEREATVEEAKKQEELAQKLAEQQRQEKQVEEPQKETGLIRNEDRSLMQKASAGFKNFFESAKEKVGKFFESVKEKFARKPDEKFGSEVYAMDATKKDKEQENDMWQRVDPREHAEKVAKQQEEKRQAIENGQEKATVNVGEKEER